MTDSLTQTTKSMITFSNLVTNSEAGTKPVNGEVKNTDAHIQTFFVLLSCRRLFRPTILLD